MGMPFAKNDPQINRQGRPKKGTAFTDILNMKLDDENKSELLRREAVAEKLIKLAEGGDIAAIKYIMDRVDGKPTQKDVIELNDIPDSARERLDRIFEDAKKESAKIQPKIIVKKGTMKTSED
jgi:hypothetical protein